MLNNYSLLPLIAAILFLSQGIFVFLNGKGNRSTKLGFLFNSCATFWWQFSWVFLFNTSNILLGKLIADIGHIGIALIPATFFHYFYAYIDPKNYWKQTKWFYITGFFFILLIPTGLFVNGVNSFYWGFYPKAGLLHPLFLAYLFIGMGACIYHLVKKGSLVKWRGLEGSQLSFLLVSFLVYCLASADFLVNYGFAHYPFGVIAILLSLTISAYAILRYRLMDIRLALSNTAIFIAVYALVLWTPFYLYAIGLKLIALFVMLVLASIGPFVLQYLQGKAKDNILQEDKRIQDVIRKTSYGITIIRDLRQLLNLIMNVLVKNLRLDFVAIYLLDSDTGSYNLNTSFPEKDQAVNIQTNNILTSYLKEKKYLIVFEEFKHLSEDKNIENSEDNRVALAMQELSASVVIPLIGEKKLLGFIILGERSEKKVYSSELISSLSILGNQVALALEIIFSIAQRDKLLNENFRKSRFESLALLCASVSHQIDNRFQGIFFSLKDPLGIFNKGDYKDLSKEEIITLLEDFAISAKESFELAKDGSTVTKGILDYSKSEVKFGLVNFDNVVDTSLNFVQLKRGKIEIKKEYPQGVFLWASQAILNEVFSNAFDNSWFAMNVKKKHFNDTNYSPLIIIRGYKNTSMFHFEIEDNGMGIKKEDIQKVFDPFFSTKGTLQGTGMGTTVMLQFIQDHGGAIAYESEYEKWTKVKISLPLAMEEKKGSI